MADRQYVTQLGTPSVDKAFDGLRTVTRISDVNASGIKTANIEAEVFLDYGTADPEFAMALLVKRGMSQVSTDNSAYKARLTEVYQEFTDATKVNVGEDQVFRLEDGRNGVVKRFVAKASQAEGLAAAIGAVISGPMACQDVKINKQGFGAEIIETYISKGKLSESNATRNGGKLLIRTLTYFNDVPPTPGGYTLIDDTTKDALGVPTYTYTFAKGEGLVTQRINARSDGLREVTNIALGTRVAPAGEITQDDYTEDDGYKVYTVSTMQTAAGGTDPTAVSYSTERYVPFKYPGRLKAFSEAYAGRTMLDVFKSPPKVTDVLATILVSYQTSNTIGALAHTKWQPSEAATMRAQWIGLGNEPRNLVEPYPDYRSVSATPVTAAASAVAPNDTSIFNQVVFGATTAKITCTGGPADPGGNTYTLDAYTELAFTNTAGTKFFRRVEIVAAIPAQAALPV